MDDQVRMEETEDTQVESGGEDAEDHDEFDLEDMR